MRFLLVGLLFLSGCAATGMGPSAPQSARLSQEQLTLTLTDATVCRVNWRAAPVGRFENCGAGFGYAVTEVSNPNILRQIWTGLTEALQADGAVPPMAEVVITDASGRDTVFVSPPPVPE